MNRSAKYLKSLVGAPRFELGTSCAQGRRSNQLSYAPNSTIRPTSTSYPSFWGLARPFGSQDSFST